MLPLSLLDTGIQGPMSPSRRCFVATGNYFATTAVYATICGIVTCTIPFEYVNRIEVSAARSGETSVTEVGATMHHAQKSTL